MGGALGICAYINGTSETLAPVRELNFCILDYFLYCSFRLLVCFAHYPPDIHNNGTAAGTPTQTKIFLFFHPSAALINQRHKRDACAWYLTIFNRFKFVSLYAWTIGGTPTQAQFLPLFCPASQGKFIVLILCRLL